MARVNLYFATTQVISPQFGNWPLTVIRLMAGVKFCQADGSLSRTVAATFDTGAPLSVLPRCLWRSLDTTVQVPETTFGGISSRKVCQIRASLGLVCGQLVDDTGQATRLYDFPAFLAQTDRVPLVIGFAGLLEKFKNHFDYPADEAWIED